jgi:hypothetical protein
MRKNNGSPIGAMCVHLLAQSVFASQDELLASLSGQRQSNSPTSLTGSLALPPSLNRSDIIGFEFGRSFRQIDYALIAPETALVNTFNGLFPNGDPPFLNAMIQASVGQTPNALVRTTIHITPAELESALGGPFLFNFRAGIEELDASGNLHPAKGESYANDSLNGVELPAQPYPVPAVQIGPVLRFNQILEIEQMTQHVVRNTISYSKAIWGSMSADERAIFLEHYTIGVPSDGIADTSQMVPLLNCVENRVLGFFGNSMMMPFLIPQAVAEQMNIDPAQLQSSLLAYQQAAFAPPQSTIALPTRGVLGEAVLGSCPSAEKIDLTRFWNWADSPADTAPTIAPVTLPTTTPSIAAGLTAPNTLTNLPPLINNVLTAPTPDTSLLQALSKAAASQQDFSPTLTGADKLASLLTSAQTTAGSALSDAMKANTQLVSQALTGAVALASQQNQQGQQAGKQDQSTQGQPGQPQPQTQPDQQSQQPQTQPDQQNQQPQQGPGSGQQGLFQLASYQPGSGAIGVSSASGTGAGPTSPICVTADVSASGGPGWRACCALGCGSSMDPTKISGHAYGGATAGILGGGGPTGYIYTAQAGLADLGHIRDQSDMTKFIYDHLVAGCTSFKLSEGTATPNASPPDLLGFAGAIAFVEGWAHELRTWGTGLYTEDYSAFSPEDLPSNVIGIEVATRAIKRVISGGLPYNTAAYNTAVDVELGNLLNVELGARPKSDTDAVLAKIRGNWFAGGRLIDCPGDLMRRNFDVAPWPAGMPYDVPSGPSWLNKARFASQFLMFSYVMKYPVDGTTGVTLASMQAATDAIRAKFVAANPGKDKP